MTPINWRFLCFVCCRSETGAYEKRHGTSFPEQQNKTFDQTVVRQRLRGVTRTNETGSILWYNDHVYKKQKKKQQPPVTNSRKFKSDERLEVQSPCSRCVRWCCCCETEGVEMHMQGPRETVHRILWALLALGDGWPGLFRWNWSALAIRGWSACSASSCWSGWCIELLLQAVLVRSQSLPL